MSKESPKKYLLAGTIVIISQNLLLLFVIIGAFANFNSDFLALAMSISYLLDLIGFGLIGFGFYNLGKYYPSVNSSIQKTSHLAFGWVALSLFWRLLMGVLIPNFYILGSPNIDNLGIYATVPSTVFGMAGIALLLFLFNLNLVLEPIQEPGIKYSRLRKFVLAYGIFHILGVIMIVLGWVPVAKIVLDSNISPFTPTTSLMSGLFLAGFGYLIKIFVVPILAIKVFSELVNIFKSID